MGAVDGGSLGEDRNRQDDSWGSLNCGRAGGAWGFGRSRLGPKGLSSSCLNLYCYMEIEELGSSPPAQGQTPQVLPTIRCEFSEESRNVPEFRLGNTM